MRRALVALVATVVGVVGWAAAASSATGVGSIKGQVTDSQTDAPLAGICVQATLVEELDRSEPRSKGSFKATTNREGNYLIADAPSGRYLVSFSECKAGEKRTRSYAPSTFRDKDGLVPAPPPGLADLTGPYAELVRVQDGVATTAIDARLGPGGRILGRVIDAAGQPLDKVCVQAQYDLQWPASARVVTGKDGLYAITGVLPRDLGAAGLEYSVLLLFTDCSKGAPRFPPTYLPEPVRFNTPRENVSLGDFTPGEDPSNATDPTSCVLPGQPDRSKESITMSTIRFENFSAVSATVYWLDFSGLRVLYKVLQPGESYTQPTFLTHPWVAVGSDSRCLGYALSNSPSRTLRFF